MRTIPIDASPAARSDASKARDDIEYSNLENNLVRRRRRNVYLGALVAIAAVVAAFALFLSASSSSGTKMGDDGDLPVDHGDHEIITQGEEHDDEDAPPPRTQTTGTASSSFTAQTESEIQALISSFFRGQEEDHRSMLKELFTSRDQVVIGAIGSSAITNACNREPTYLELLVDKLNAAFSRKGRKPKFSLQKQSYDAW